MRNMKLGRRYAEAIYEVAKEKNKIKETYEVLNSVMILFKQNLDFKNLIMNPLITIKEKEKFIVDIFKDTEEDILKIIFFILEKNRINFIRSIVTEYLKIYFEKNKILDVQATFTRELTEEEENKLIQKLEKQMNKQINLEVYVDETILGGGILKIGDRVIDGSIRNDLKNWKK